jgi:dolichyl-diphosphooligosaccharide--protein glycosyltransferase
MERVNAVPGNGKYAVTEPVEVDVPPESIQARLHENLGSRNGDVDGLAHFRALYVSQSGDYKVFRTVPGATLQGQVASDESVAVSTTVTIDGATVEYTRRAKADDEGAFSVVVPYPGTYELEPAAGETRTVTVDEAAVHENATVTVDW